MEEKKEILSSVELKLEELSQKVSENTGVAVKDVEKVLNNFIDIYLGKFKL
jgi:hypothetical protein